ncbi:MAG TPA: DUF3459 domain-containing protein, partial [Bradyrhizobium sp.]|nr:DUF3459 domain-containing protein [Bradyrhizobium sp.]
IADSGAIEAALAVMLIAPTIPMLFMGEEWGATTPFPFFCDFHGDLAHAVRQGRAKEFAWAYARYGDEIPDPLDKTTVESAVLDWDARDTETGRQRLTLVRDLLKVRRREIVPRLADARFGEASAPDDGLFTAYWRMGDGKRLRLRANLSDRNVIASDDTTGTPIWGRELKDSVPPWTVSWRIG